MATSPCLCGCRTASSSMLRQSVPAPPCRAPRPAARRPVPGRSQCPSCTPPHCCSPAAPTRRARNERGRCRCPVMRLQAGRRERGARRRRHVSGRQQWVAIPQRIPASLRRTSVVRIRPDIRVLRRLHCCRCPRSHSRQPARWCTSRGAPPAPQLPLHTGHLLPRRQRVHGGAASPAAWQLPAVADRVNSHSVGEAGQQESDQLPQLFIHTLTRGQSGPLPPCQKGL